VSGEVQGGSPYPRVIVIGRSARSPRAARARAPPGNARGLTARYTDPPGRAFYRADSDKF